MFDATYSSIHGMENFFPCSEWLCYSVVTVLPHHSPRVKFSRQVLCAVDEGSLVLLRHCLIHDFAVALISLYFLLALLFINHRKPSTLTRCSYTRKCFKSPLKFQSFHKAQIEYFNKPWIRKNISFMYNIDSQITSYFIFSSVHRLLISPSKQKDVGTLGELCALFAAIYNFN